MSCLSDIDLATLHRNRLEERFNYKLMRPKLTTKRDSSKQTVKSMATTPSSLSPSPDSSIRSSCNSSAPQISSSENISEQKQQVASKKQSLVTLDDMNMNLLSNRFKHLDLKWNPDRLLLNGDDSLSSLENEDDYNYFASSTRRRRSGTWP